MIYGRHTKSSYSTNHNNTKKTFLSFHPAPSSSYFFCFKLKTNARAPNASALSTRVVKRTKTAGRASAVSTAKNVQVTG